MGAGWQDALRELALRLGRTDVEWMLIGSAATALHGVELEPGDLDVAVATPAGVRAAAHVLPCRRQRSPTTAPGLWFSSREEPILTFGDPAGTRWTFGRWMLGDTKVELAHLAGQAPPEKLIETSGTAVWNARTSLEWNGVRIPVVPLEVQLATMIVRDQADRLRATLEAIDDASLNVAMLRRALADRAVPSIPEAIHDLTARDT
jgi:hypothetical protein